MTFKIYRVKIQVLDHLSKTYLRFPHPSDLLRTPKTIIMRRCKFAVEAVDGDIRTEILCYLTKVDVIERKFATERVRAKTKVYYDKKQAQE